MEVAEGIHRQTLGVANWYLVEDGGRLTVVDAGTPADWSTLQEALGSLRRTLDDVEAVLLTHAHSDHTGFAERARSEANKRVYIHTADGERARGAKPPKNQAGLGRYLLRPEAYRTLVGLMRQKGMNVVPIAEVSTFADAETIDVPGRPRVIHMPGHTAGSCAMWFEQRSVVCTGDSLVTRNPLTGRRGPQIAPDGLNLDSDRALDSLTALARTGATMLLPGHGDPWTRGAGEAVRQARAAGRS
jgi:glyoxylase-like metal-dependent hydrolase (beta-lactamase superfamily II)